MRTTSVLEVARKIPKEPVPFKALMPLKLKQTVSGKGENTSEANEFDQSLCSKEIEAFQKCYTNHMTKKTSLKEKEAKGILTPGEKNLSHKQLNLLLKRYPNVK